MGSLLTRMQEVLSSCFSPSKTSSHGGPDEMTDIARPTRTGTLKVDQLSSPIAEKDGDKDDHLLVQNGQRRTLALRKQLAYDDSTPFKDADMANAPLFQDLSDTQFIRQLQEAFEPELNDLRNADVTVEQGSEKVIGGYGDDENLSPSELLYGAVYPEVDRTIVGILAMKWILINDYEKFTRYQNKAIKLSKSSFEELRDIFIKAFVDSAGPYMLIVSMIINDLGKNSAMRELIRSEEPKRWLVMNHDEVIFHAAYYRKLPLINEFHGEQRRRLMKGIELGMMLNLGQLAQGECVPRNLEGVADVMQDDSRAFPMKFCEIVLDVAGAAGHIDSRGANAWISPVNEAYRISQKCVKKVIEGISSREAYDGILQGRAELLVSKGFRELNVKIPEDRSLLRLMTMSRAANKNAAQAIEDAVSLLSPTSPKTNSGRVVKDFFGHPIKNVKDALLQGLMVDGINDGVAIIPYYGPGVLAEAARVTKASPPELQTKATAAVLRFFARIFIGTRPLPGKPGHVVDCDISFIQGTIRSSAFLENPDILDEIEYPVDKDPYGRPIEELMKEIYSIRRIGRRRAGSSQRQA